MSFYGEPAFFVLLAAALIPAIILGLLQKPMRVYGLIVSVLFLVGMFGGDLYGAASFVGFLVLSIVLAFWTLRCFTKDDKNAVIKYRIALVLNIAPLAIYKFGAVFDQNLLGFLGISYIMFKAVQVLIEIRDGLIKEMSLLDYIYFLIFFPTFTSGPIMRSRQFEEDLRTPLSRQEYLSRLSWGALRFVGGVTYKFVFAALFSWLMWFVPQTLGSSTPGLILAEVCVSLFYGLYLFFDFAGYSLMAMGAGAAFGINVPRNFHFPFLSVDIKDFWNRWHITLSYWLRDFVFMRFTKMCLQRKVFKKRLTTACIAFIVNMTIMGFWHGITIDYIAYGLFHGLLLAGCELFQKKSKFYKKHKDAKAYKVASWAFTMVAVFFGFSLFSGQISRLLGL